MTQVYFVRHNFLHYMEQNKGESDADFEQRKASPEWNFAQQMLAEKKFAYGHCRHSHRECLNGNFREEEGFAKAHSAAKMFAEMLAAKDDALVVAEYELYDLPAKASYKKVLFGKIDSKEVEDCFNKNGFPMKTLHFAPDTVRELKIEDYPVYLAARPPYTTVCRPQSCFFTCCIPVIYDGKPLKADVKLLHYKMLEQLCEEYLRRFGVEGVRMTNTICKVGKSLSVFDIIGRLENGKKVFAQVKADREDDTAERYLRLYKESDKACYLFFDDCRAGENRRRIAVSEVFGRFAESAWGRKMLADMIGIDDSLLTF